PTGPSMENFFTQRGLVIARPEARSCVTPSLQEDGAMKCDEENSGLTDPSMQSGFLGEKTDGASAITRRTFLKSASVAGTALGLGGKVLGAPAVLHAAEQPIKFE